MTKNTYKTINNLPIDYDFSSKSKEELKLYAKWFEENKDARLNELIQFVKSTKGYENWQSDYSPESLKELGKWLSENVETERLSEEEYRNKRASVPDYIEIRDWDLTIKTRSILVDAGIYFGEVFIRNNQGLKWEQYFSRIKKDIDNGHMVINLGKKELNPIWIMYIIGSGFADNTESEDSLFITFENWCNIYLK